MVAVRSSQSSTSYHVERVLLNPLFTCDSIFIHLLLTKKNYDYLVDLAHLYYYCFLCVSF